MSHGFHLGQQLVTRLHTQWRRGNYLSLNIWVIGFTAVLNTHKHTHTLFNPNISGSAVHTHLITATDRVIQHDTNLLIRLDGQDIGLEGKLRSEYANMPAHTVWFAPCVSAFPHMQLQAEGKAWFTHYEVIVIVCPRNGSESLSLFFLTRLPLSRPLLLVLLFITSSAFYLLTVLPILTFSFLPSHLQ